MIKEKKIAVSVTLPKGTFEIVNNTISESDGLLQNFSAGVNYLILKGVRQVDQEKIKLASPKKPKKL